MEGAIAGVAVVRVKDVSEVLPGELVDGVTETLDRGTDVLDAAVEVEGEDDIDQALDQVAESSLGPFELVVGRLQSVAMGACVGGAARFLGEGEAGP